MNKHDISEELKSLFWGAVGECDCNNESARAGIDAVVEFIGNILDERDNIARNANAKSAAHERIEHANQITAIKAIKKEYFLIQETLDSLTNEERLTLISHYCKHCGRRNPNCQCQNSE